MDKTGLEKLIKRLPKNPGILGKEENYFNSAVLITLVEISGKYQFLFEVRAKKIRQENEICFPGGKYEPGIDANYEAAAVRETSEELGILKEQIDVKGEIDTVIAPMGATINSFVAVLDICTLNELSINKREVARVFTIPVSYFRENSPRKYQTRLEVQPSYKGIDGREEIYLPSWELGLPEKYRRPWGGKKYNIYVYKLKDKIIWGITAQLVREFIRLSI